MTYKKRPDNRKFDEAREIEAKAGVIKNADGIAGPGNDVFVRKDNFLQLLCSGLQYKIIGGRSLGADNYIEFRLGLKPEITGYKIIGPRRNIIYFILSAKIRLCANLSSFQKNGRSRERLSEVIHNGSKDRCGNLGLYGEPY